MAYQRDGKGNLAIKYYQRRAKISNDQVAKVLNITIHTYIRYLKNPFTLRLSTIYTLAGLFNVSVEELIYCISRNQQRANDVDKWYLLEQYEKGDKVISKLNYGK